MKNDLGRDGSPSRPELIGRDVSPKRPQSNQNGALGESALLPKSNGGFGETALPRRKILSHDVPDWVPDGVTFFITINTVPRGNNQLAIPAVAEGLVESLVVRIEKGQWWPWLMLFMPDHVHGLITFAPDQTMQKVVRDWKRFMARNAGIHWQRDFFDHRIRNETSLAEKWNYIIQNPVRAGLVTSAEEWPFVWFGRDVSPKRPESIGRDGSPSRPIVWDGIGRDVIR